jgi:hypothetical protein
MFKIFYKGQTLIEELAYSHYFHSATLNQIIHTYGFLINWPLIYTLIWILLGKEVAIFTLLMLVIAYSSMVLEIGLLYAFEIPTVSFALKSMELNQSTLLFWLVGNFVVIIFFSHKFIQGYTN